MMFPPKHRTNERGAAAVEFALVVPVLLLILIGIINYGFVFAQQISLNNGARQAARHAVVEGRTCAQIEAQARSGAATIGMPESDVPTPVITGCSGPAVQPCTGLPTGSDITVTMTHESEWVINIVPFNAIPTPELEGVGVMRCEYS